MSPTPLPPRRLPAPAEIDKLVRQLRTSSKLAAAAGADQLRVLPLHGALPATHQNKVGGAQEGRVPCLEPSLSPACLHTLPPYLAAAPGPRVSARSPHRRPGV